MTKKIFTAVIIFTLSLVALANTGVGNDEMLRIAKKNAQVRSAIKAAQEPGWAINGNVATAGSCTQDGNLAEGFMYKVTFIKVVASPNPHYAYRSMAIVVADATLDCEGNIVELRTYFK